MPYSIFTFNSDSFLTVLSESSGADKNKIKGKQHYNYLLRYLNDISVKTIIIEKDYVDHDFLEDYASYYVSCFFPYKKRCARAHFFKIDISEDKFSQALSGKNVDLIKKLQNEYQGFCVIKPLPRTIIGRTCINTYPIEGGKSFPSCRNYEVNLFGIPLKVNTIAYQEQDSVAAACATSSLWSMFHVTGKLFHHSIHTPVEITKAATKNLPCDNRALPNKGLTIEQMSQAIRETGLEPNKIGIASAFNLKAFSYAYMKAKIPLILAIYIADTSQTSAEIYAAHAVAITGFSMINDVNPQPVEGTSFHLKSNNINKLYVHDDQIGPFSKIKFDGEQIELDKLSAKKINNSSPFSMWSSWKGKYSDIEGDGRLIPFAILIPLYKKIRIPFESIYNIIFEFDALFNKYLLYIKKEVWDSVDKNIVWDIFLSTVNAFKEEKLNCTELKDDSKEKILTKHMPKYIWRAIATVEKEYVMEFVFDATDIEQGNILVETICYNKDLHYLLSELLKMNEWERIISKYLSYKLFKSFEIPNQDN